MAFSTIVAKIFGWSMMVNALVLGIQSLHLYVEKRAEGVSVTMFIVFFLLNINGAVYGFHLKNTAMMWGLSLSAVVCFTIVLQVLLY